MANITITGGENAAKYLAALKDKLAKASKVEIGWNKDAQYPASHRNGGDFVANVAAINEWGGEWSGTRDDGKPYHVVIPRRPFFRTMVAGAKSQYGLMLYRELEANGFDSSKALNALGEIIGEELSLTIATWSEPGNAKRTIARKKIDNPLVETKLMMTTVNHWVK